MWRRWVAALGLALGLICLAQAQTTPLRLLLSGGPLDPAVVAWVNAVGTVSAAQKTNVNNLVKGLKTDGIWTTFDRVWLFDADTATQTQTDLVNLQQWSIGAGSQSLGASGTKMSASGWIDSGFASNGLTNFTQNNLHMSAYVTVTDSGCSGDCAIMGLHGVATNLGLDFVLRSGALRTLMAANCIFTDNIVFAGHNNNGFWVGTRNGAGIGADTYYYYDNGTGGSGISTSNCGDASQTLTTGHPYFFAVNDQGTPVSFTQVTLGVVTFGSAWTSTQATNAAARFNTYESARGNNLW